MSELAEATPDESAPPSGVANWAAMIHLAKIEEVVRSLTGGPWSVLPDPDNPGAFYLSGAPGTRVVAEGMTQEDATSLAYLISELPEALEYFEDLASLWDVLNDGTLDSQDELSTYVDIIRKYQMKIAQLEANAAPIPEVATAGELSFMHVGHMFRILTESENGEEGYGFGPIVSVSQDRFPGLTTVELDDGNFKQAVHLSKATPIEVVLLGSIAQIEPIPAAPADDDPAVDPVEPPVED